MSAAGWLALLQALPSVVSSCAACIHVPISTLRSVGTLHTERSSCYELYGAGIYLRVYGQAR